MSASSDAKPPTITPGDPEVLFGCTAESCLAARVGDSAFAILPALGDEFYLGSAWRLNRPIEEWTHGDFYGHGGRLANENAFRERVAENADHQRQLKALDRRNIAAGASTPWGLSQQATLYAEGIICHSTASHGGFHLTTNCNRLVHPSLRAADGWYEEDCCWAAVAQSFPGLFTEHERRSAEHTIRDYFPDAWEAINGVSLTPGQSHAKDSVAFEREHAADWVVVSAITYLRQAGFVECIATLGGNRSAPEQRRYLVPADEYRAGPHGFVIDEVRHHVDFGPSSFPGWSQVRSS